MQDDEIRPPSSFSNYEKLRHGASEDQTQALQQSPAMDGRQLFKVVKQRISSEKFQRFLQTIKALNSQAISKADAMAQIENEVLGTENKDLFPTLYHILHPSSQPAE